MQCGNKKRPINNLESSPTKASSSLTSKKNKSSQDVAEESKSSDEAFHLSLQPVREILKLICAREPLKDKYKDEYTTSFYMKTRALFERYKELGETSSEELTPEEDHHMESTKHLRLISEKDLKRLARRNVGFCRLVLTGPYKFAFYSPGKEPEHMPYHLYLLVKEAVDIMNKYSSELEDYDTNSMIKLKTVEEKIWFFCKYFYSHLPADWSYTRETASTLVANYDPPLQLKNNMSSYTPITNFYNACEYDEYDQLSRREMIDIMSTIHSRRTPAYWKPGVTYALFYCKVCSCFGIDYHRLEAASEDDVCLMNMGDFKL